MGEIINTNTAIETQPGGDTGALLDITQSLLADARTALNSSGVLSVPIAELSTLGAGVSSLIPALNTVSSGWRWSGRRASLRLPDPLRLRSHLQEYPSSGQYAALDSWPSDEAGRIFHIRCLCLLLCRL